MGEERVDCARAADEVVFDDDQTPIIVNDKTPLPPQIWEWMERHDLNSKSEKFLGEQLGQLRLINDNSQREAAAKAKIREAFKAAYRTKEEAIEKKTDLVRAFEVLCNKGTEIELMRDAENDGIKFTHYKKEISEEQLAAMPKAKLEVYKRQKPMHLIYKRVTMRGIRLFDECIRASFPNASASKKRKRDNEESEDDEEPEDPETKAVDRHLDALESLCRSKKYTEELCGYVNRRLDKIKAIKPYGGPKQTKIPQQRVPLVARRKNLPLGSRKLR
jgi:hypothetical protein